MGFFLRLIATTDEQIPNQVLLHSLRLIANTCADTGVSSAYPVREKKKKKKKTKSRGKKDWADVCPSQDENRDIAVNDNYILVVMRYFRNPELVHVAIPVVYNICADYGESEPVSGSVLVLSRTY